MKILHRIESISRKLSSHSLTPTFSGLVQSLEDDSGKPIRLILFDSMLFIYSRLDDGESADDAVWLKGSLIRIDPWRGHEKHVSRLTKVSVSEEEVLEWALLSIDFSRDSQSNLRFLVPFEVSREWMEVLRQCSTEKGKGCDVLKNLVKTQRSAKIWVFSWNMGVKEHFKIPSDVPEHLQKVYTATQIDKLDKLIPSGYDVYIFGLQECISDRFWYLIQRLLATRDCRRIPLDPEDDRVWGRGDGSFLSPKFTGIAMYVSNKSELDLSIIGAAGTNLSVFEGSKGGAAVAARILGSTIVFICSHLPAKHIEDRRKGYRLLMKQLGHLLCNHRFELQSLFHHIVFFGDLNYRTSGISSDKAIELIECGDLDQLRAYDELLIDMEVNQAFPGFWEPGFKKDFFPTYKKKETRPLLDKKSDWVQETYRTRYKEPWYKSGKTKDRIPSYTDRVLVRSMRNSPAMLSPEHIDGVDVYGSFNNDFTGSDHTAVYCGLELTRMDLCVDRLQLQCRWNVKILDLYIFNETSRFVPKSARLVFPLPFEDGNDFSLARLVTKDSLEAEMGPALRWQGPGDLPAFHIMFRVLDVGEFEGEVVCTLNVNDFIDSSVCEFEETLYCKGIPTAFQLKFIAKLSFEQSE